MTIRTATLLIALAASAPVLAADGIAIHAETRDIGQDGVHKSRMLVAGNKLRLEVAAQGDVVVFDGERQNLVIIDANDKSYMVLDRAKMKRLSREVSGAMSDMRKQLDERMKGMTPEQRAMVEQMMKARMPGMAPPSEDEPPPPPPVKIRKQGEEKKIDAHRCVRYDLIRGEAKVSEAWLTTWKSAGVSSDTFEVFRELGRFFEELTASLGSNPMLRQQLEGQEIFESLARLEGFPMLIRGFENGRPTDETRIVSIERIDATAASFTAPAGFVERQLPMPTQGM